MRGSNTKDVAESDSLLSHALQATPINEALYEPFETEGAPEVEVEFADIRRVESHPFWSRFRWSYIDSFLERQLQSLVIGGNAISENPVGCCSMRVWLSGRSIPVRTPLTLSSVYAIRAGLKGVEGAIFTTLHVFITSLLGYHLYLLVSSGDLNVKQLWGSLIHSNESGLLNIVQGMARLPRISLQLILASPFIWGGVRAFWAFIRSQRLSEAQLESKLGSAVPKWGGGLLSSEALQWLPMISARNTLQSLERALRWDGGLTPDQRERIFSHIDGQARYGAKRFQRDAIQSLAKIADSFHFRELGRLRGAGYSEEELQRLRTLKINSVRTLRELAGEYQEVGDSEVSLSHFSRLKRYRHQGVRRTYARYLLWWLGQSTSRRSSVAFWLFKLIKLGSSILFIKTIVTLIQEAIDCPKQQGFQFGRGFAPWAGEYTTKCFEERIRFFRTLNPHESVADLVEELQHYHLVGLTELNLLDKGLTWPEAQVLIAAVIARGARIKQLWLGAIGLPFDVNQNSFGSLPNGAFKNLPKLHDLSLNYSNVDNITEHTFDGLPELRTLDLSNNNLEKLSSNCFSQLLQLQVLDLSLNAFVDLPAGLFVGLSKLQSLALNDNFLLNSFPLDLPRDFFVGLSQLTSLSLSNNNFNNLPTGLFLGLSQLRALDLSGNVNLSNLPTGFFMGLSQLQTLSLWGDDLGNLLADLFAGLFELRHLNLRAANLDNLPEGLFVGLTLLQSLDLSDNKLNTLSTDSFVGLSELHRLDLSNNNFSSLPENLFTPLLDLETLDLTSNSHLSYD